MTSSSSLACSSAPFHLLLAIFLSCLASPTAAASTFALVPPSGTRFSPRTQTMNFAWGGAIWVAGGYDASAQTVLSDVWGSYDFGRTWTQPVDNNGRVVDLPGPCASAYSKAVVYAGAVYLVCGSNQNDHSLLGLITSTSLTLSSPWTQLDDGCDGCGASPVVRMAVPFDGVGTLITVNPADGSSNLYWYSATGNFQPTIDMNSGSAVAGSGIPNRWVIFQAVDATDAYTTPWPPRLQSSTTVDSEGLQMIMTGGIKSDDYVTKYNDVWQLTWQSSFLPPFVSQLTAHAQFYVRGNAALYTVHDWYFLAGGVNFDGYLDDVWMSGDLGSTWTQFTAAATGHGGFIYPNRLTLGRRLFIVTPTYTTGNNNDVYQAVW